MSQRGSMTPQGVRTNSLTAGAMTENTVGFCCFSGRRDSGHVCIRNMFHYSFIISTACFYKRVAHFCHWVNTVKRRNSWIIPLMWQKLCLKVMTQGDERVCVCVSERVTAWKSESDSIVLSHALGNCLFLVFFFLNSRSPGHTNICGGLWSNEGAGVEGSWDHVKGPTHLTPQTNCFIMFSFNLLF